MSRVIQIAAASILVGTLVLALKAAAWWLTGSAALYSDALETVVNVAASALALFALRFAAQPADANHPYGHAKAEFVAAVVEGVLIVVAAISILQHAWITWRHPHVLTAALPGLALNACASGLNAVWATVLLRAGRGARSPALIGDARHLFGDVVISCGVLAGLGLVLLTGQLRFDPALAAATALYVLWSGMRLIGSSVGGLMDQAPDDGTIERICAVLRESGLGAIEAHELRTRNAGRVTFLQFHLVVPGKMEVRTAHDICDRIEAALTADMPHLVVSIHVEPVLRESNFDALVL